MDWNNNTSMGWIVDFRGKAEGAIMGMLLVDLRNEWAIQCLVLFSFALQVFLLSFAGIRRHNVSFVPRLLLWLAYQLADSTALFTLGHLSISSKLPEHQLVAFWAPFLLVHLGGQDTVTAYSFEDNRLRLAHLQTLVMAAAYVLYMYMPSSETLIVVAAVLIFAVGVLKYGERIVALRSASFDSIWTSLDNKSGTTSQSESESESHEKLLFRELLKRRFFLELDAEAVLLGAHGLLDDCKGLFIGARKGRREYVRDVLESFQMYDRLDKLMEMELSLMYDILYTKAGVIHTWYGYSIRVISLVATLAAFWLFQLSHKHGHSRKDVGITYVLLVGAMVLEMTSVVRAAGSTWTRAFLYYRKWYVLHGELLALRRLVNAAGYRRWSGSVGQYNLLESRARDAGKLPPGVKTARLLGLGHMAEDWWDELRHSRSAELSGSTKELVLREILEMGNRGEQIGSLPGLLTLRRFGMDRSVAWSVQDVGFEDSIMAWHLATDICLSNEQGNDTKEDVMDAIRVLSNYMMFLLALRPYMLPGPVRRSRYIHHRRAWHEVMLGQGSENSTQGRLASALRAGLHARVCSLDHHEDYDTGVRLADVLYHYHRPDCLDVIFGVWVEMLCYVANHCSRESHARQLSSGGELVTIVWLMARHANLS
ncbi:hypothetical protein TRIUR3_11112 [Triticum urartu]|uniref:Uncharacterized protein n=1 Tax=Triticum urartu TaxID=4572 RepID=M7YEG9_TRIUA|nr:hypothetical protein TRIUR3_11112 [Triticum urartu]